MSRRRQLLGYLGSRLLLAPVMLWLIATLVFLLLRLAPGDPIDALLGTRAPEAARQALRQQLGLDQPLPAQYGHFLADLVKGNLGESLTNQTPVLEVIRQSLPASLELGLCALLIAAVLGLAVGFSGIARPEGRLDLAGRLYGIGTYALPPFWAAMVIQLIFAVWLGWLPVGGRFPATLMPPSGSGFYLLDSLRAANPQQLAGSLRHLVLPASTLGLLLSGIFANALRLNLRRVLRSDYVEAARSRGLSETRVVLRHAMPNALLPVLTITGITVASLIGGALLIEVTYSWPGIAFRLQEAIGQRDYPLVQGIVVVVAALVVLVSVTVDMLVAVLDPRIRF
ncbi:ABC transporter permease [Synechococcus sp. Cruz-9H2]|uniref:ABC transporter permease n=1 Tax=unclassified Synechococcus TaxID=2626047 RepID=UPI0020CD80DB|nr:MULTISPECIES: ABC transporter permease [unclassified Synechococcus]MCP9818669.1 ABC transporter permease [Synechococcus sp. Cruz-9H2]MCP9842899.1 ABC transporter permease [Synechococcus sp. Edmonson 11F2]MCP9855924.1 ABC transporter permease [Synechococcus sp. Cruz-9C9]MCP9862189.1 ABC transporter permease [Synechococcus sp. Cruz-7E5]MCP9869460.1 ABC transporter permease [Synechococcus sp. Cruz-7B9]